MRDETLGQPAGGELLTEFLGHAQHVLRNTKYNKPLYYKMEMGHVGDHARVNYNLDDANKTSLHQPSYNITVFYNQTAILVGYYQLDSRFSMEVSQEESERVEDFMANEVLGLMACYGVCYYIGARNNGNLMSILRKESDDKKFLPLN